MSDAWRPIGLYLLAVAMLMAGSYLKRQERLVLLPVVWSTLALSFKDVAKASSLLGFNIQLGMTIYITILWAPVLLSSSPDHLRLSAPLYDLPAAYKQFNNPRRLDPVPKNRLRASLTKRLRFSALRAIEAFLILAIRAFRDRAVAPVLANVTMGDFRPSREWIIPRVLGGQLTAHELAIRAHISLSWVFDTYAQLTILHSVIGVIFVAFLQFDEPQEWPSLFGSPLEAYTVRRFWGRFWHRLVSPIAVAWASAMASYIPSLRGKNSQLRKPFIAFFVFTVSGLAHVLVGWRLGDEALERDLHFFWANFVVVTLEIVVGKLACLAIRSGLPTKMSGVLDDARVVVVAKCVGFLWVTAWFVATIPHVLYPKIHASISAQLLAATFGQVDTGKAGSVS